MFKRELIKARSATKEDVDFVMQRKSPDTGLCDPSKNMDEKHMFCLEYDGDPIIVCGLRFTSIYAHTGWVWCVFVDPLPIPVKVMAKMARAMCESYSERVDNLMATLVGGSYRTRRFAEWLGFEIDNELTNKYNLPRTKIARYIYGNTTHPTT